MCFEGAHKKNGKVRCSKKWASAYISLVWGAAPSQPTPTNFGVANEVADVVKCAKFHVDRLRDFGLSGISRVSTGSKVAPRW
jgi:hypothetical protein